MASASDPLGNTAQVSYDGNGQRVSVVDPLGRTRIWTLDAVGRLLTYSVAGASQLLQVFDAAGRLTSRTLGDGTLTAYTYDASGRLTAIDYTDRADATFTYTDAGRRATVTDQRGTTSYGYDAQGRLTSVASPEGSIGYGYDAASRMISLTTAAGTTTYVRDDLGRISGVTDPEGGVYVIERDTAGRVSTVTYPNGVIETFARDAAGRVMSVTVTNALGTVLASHTAQRDVAGRITALDDVFAGVVGTADVSRDFGYDAAGRLTQVISNATGSSSTVDYTLDGLGNRATTTVDGTSTASTVNDLDQLTTQGSNAFTYDDAGRLTSATGPSGTSTFAWSSQGELLTAATPAGTVDYAYDTDGNVTTRTETGAAVDYVYDTLSGLPRAVSASDGTWWIYADGMILAQHTGTGSTTPGTTAYLHSDVRGDVRTATDATGTITDTWTWTVDGQQTARTGTTNVTVGWRGETVDTTTGLIWLRARWYDPTTARFLSADPWHGNPANPISLNRYAYANADPVNGHDPTGLAVLTDTVAAAEIRGALAGIAISLYGLATLKAIESALGIAAPPSEAPLPPGVEDPRDDPSFSVDPAPNWLKYPTATDSSLTVYRVWGGISGPFGASWTTVNPKAVEGEFGTGSFRYYSGIPYGNTAEWVTTGVLDAGATVQFQDARQIAGTNPLEIDFGYLVDGNGGLDVTQHGGGVVPEVIVPGGCANPSLVCMKHEALDPPWNAAEADFIYRP